MEKLIGIIDLKSFYASCECCARHLDPFCTPLVCCDPYRGDGTIVMSSSPYLKKHYGVPNVCRRRDLPRLRDMIFATPRMSYYLQMSARVVSIFLNYVAEEDLHVYSVDESFLNLGPYVSLYKKSGEEIIRSIQNEIHDKLGLIATAGLGPNMFLAKLALDNDGKKNPPYLAHWDYSDVPTKLWKISQITKIWGIANGTEAHLKRIGIRSVEELAKAPLSLLQGEFGIMGKQLHDLANGIDESDIEEKYVPKNRSLSLGQTLLRDYRKDEARLIIKEMIDDLSRRLRRENLLSQKISLWVGYSSGYGGFAKQMALPIATDDTISLSEDILFLFDEFIEELPIRNLSISFGKLTSSNLEQGSIFLDPSEREKRASLDDAMDMIKNVYASNAVLRCSSLSKASTIKQRHDQIGGHRR